MTRNPNFRGEKPTFDELQWIKYGNTDAVERALTLGEIDVIPEVEPATFARLGKTKNIKAVKAPSPSFTELAFNLCRADICPDAKFNPAVQDLTVRQAIAYAIDRERINQIASRGTAFAGHGLLPKYYKAFYRSPARRTTRSTSTRPTQMLDEAGWTPGEDGVREKGGQRLSFDLFVRSESQQNIAGRAARERDDEADRRRLQGPDRQRGQAHRDHHAQGRRQDGAGLRHVHLGLGRRPVRPGPAAQPADHEGDRRLVGLVLLQPRVRPALRAADRRVRPRRSARRSSSR